MGIRFRYNVRVQSRETAAPPGQRGLRVLGGAVLFLGCVALVCWNIGFGRYAVTGLFWAVSSGTVISDRMTSDPTIEFTARDGATYRFSEDYWFVCGRRSFCFVRDFDPGEEVPVVYDPSAPRAAFVDDWALRAGVISWFLELAGALYFAVLLTLLVTRKPLDITIEG